MEAGYGGLRLRQVAVEDIFSFSCRTRAATSALVTKAVGSSSMLTGRRTTEKWSVFGVAPRLILPEQAQETDEWLLQGLQ